MPENGAGALDGYNYAAAPGSTMLYAGMNAYDNPRVGFQAPDSPAAITEASFNPTTRIWSVAKLSI